MQIIASFTDREWLDQLWGEDRDKWLHQNTMRYGYSCKFNFIRSFTNPHLKLWASCQIRKITGCACARNAGNVFPRDRLQRKLLVSDPEMHHGTCVTHVPWCMSGSLNRGGGENVPDIPGACATRNITYLARGICRGWIITSPSKL